MIDGAGVASNCRFGRIGSGLIGCYPTVSGWFTFPAHGLASGPHPSSTDPGKSFGCQPAQRERGPVQAAGVQKPPMNQPAGERRAVGRQ